MSAEVLDDPDGLALIHALMREIIQVAQAEGVVLDDKIIEAEMTRSRTHLRAVRTSTLQDSERGKPLEYDALTGAVIRAARPAWNRGPAHDGDACADRLARQASARIIRPFGQPALRPRANDRQCN